MGQDIRELLKQDKHIPSEFIQEGHEQRFLSKLEKNLPVETKKNKKVDRSWLRVAASVVIIISVSFFGYKYLDSGTVNVDGDLVGSGNSEVKNATVVIPKQSSSLAQISPEYKKTENYFLTSIKFGLSQININDDNRDLVESFMKRLENLDNEYQSLNEELLEVGPNAQSVEAMMENLSLRLSLLNRLKNKLKELEKIENENYIDIQA